MATLPVIGIKTSVALPTLSHWLISLKKPQKDMFH